MEGEVIEVVETGVIEAVVDGSKCCWSLSDSEALRLREDPLRFDALFDSVALEEASRGP